ncbi:transposable element Tc1 transposase [Trichonephila clavipes]|nr:transposable element Tc1 transposase [Trichonephila clavipes]
MRQRIVGGLEVGHSQIHICRESNLTRRVIFSLWKVLRHRVHERIPGLGHPRASTAKEDRHLSIIATDNRVLQLSRELYAGTGIRVSRVTVSRRLHERRLFVRRFADQSCEQKSSFKVLKRLWSWSMDECKVVLFTDESRFSLTSDSRLIFIYTEPATHYLHSNVSKIDSIGGITLNGRTHHAFERSTVTAARYRDEVLEPYVRLFIDDVGSDFILMDDNAGPPRTTHLIDEFLESEDIRRMDWPVRSPDLIPIQHA